MAPFQAFHKKYEYKTCPQCGALMSKPKKHKRWHKRNEMKKPAS
jgi:hypothetical protein